MDDNLLTDVDHWDDYWETRGSIKKIQTNDPILGKDGCFLKALRGNVGSICNKKVLELGGAASYYLLSMSLFENVEATAVDYAENGLLQLQRIYEIHGRTVNTVCVDIFNHDFADNYDLVTHWGLLEHFTDPYPVMEVSAKALSPSGKVVFSMPNMHALGVGLWKKYDENEYDKCIYHSDETIIEAAKKAGLEFDNTFYWGAPFLANIGYWPVNRFLSLSVKSVVRVLALLNKIIPIYHKGHPWFSMRRAFVFQKM